MPALAIGVFTDRVLATVDDRFDADALVADLVAIDFEAKAGSIAVLPGRGGWDRVYAVGLGEEVTTEGLRQAAGSLGRVAKGEVVSLLGLVDVEEAERAAAEGFVLGAYRFSRYKSSDQPPPPSLVNWSGDPITEAVTWTRDLVNEPAVDQMPAEIADRVVAIGAELGFEVGVLGIDELREGGFGGILGVNAGSVHEARLLDIRYRP